MDKLPHTYAYVWLVMHGDRYVPGVITSVYSIAATNPNADLVVMVTDDVPARSIESISKLAKVVIVPYITFIGKFNHDDPRGKYSSWIESSYTKWQCLRLKYNKIFLLDADTIVTKNIDEVFTYPAPAGIFQQQKPLYNSVLSKYLNAKHNLPEKTTLLPVDIDRLLNTKNQLLASASSILLEPTGDVFSFILAISELKDKTYPNTTGVDEQAIAYYMSVVLKKSWTVLSTKYNAVPWWKYGSTIGHAYGKILHFMTKEKPWERNTSEFPELMEWAKMQSLAYAEINKKESKLPLAYTEINKN